ncbi:MAG TPA: TetR/AcrR family transcriptional regulator [Dongiaceae bacterium]|jgi:AcrR family transcriptional regulator|nr:TetR/AcrR family transcriptional regulator [Dongiaceae bacterium]
MTGLRAKHKADRHQRIVEAAAGLFRTQGYDTVKMEAIAAAAEVSIGTIYNYYKNKGDLLVAIVSMEVHEVLAAGERVIADPPRNAEKAVAKLIANYIEHALVYLSKEMWRQAMAITTQQPDSPSGVAYNELDEALARQTSKLIRKLQTLGLVQVGVDAQAIGELIFNNTNMMFTIFVKQDSMSVATLLARLRRQNRTLVQAIAA